MWNRFGKSKSRALATGGFMLSLVLSGCGTSVDLQQVAKQLQPGDTEAKVLELCGEPDSKTDTPYGPEWRYESEITQEDGSKGTFTLRVGVKDGKVYGVGKSTRSGG